MSQVQGDKMKTLKILIKIRVLSRINDDFNLNIPIKPPIKIIYTARGKE